MKRLPKKGVFLFLSLNKAKIIWLNLANNSVHVALTKWLFCDIFIRYPQTALDSATECQPQSRGPRNPGD
jgi:hypothetical protein